MDLWGRPKHAHAAARLIKSLTGAPPPRESMVYRTTNLCDIGQEVPI
jgi:hypothetical protein